MATEKRLIDANALFEHIKRRMAVTYPNLFPGLHKAIEYIEKFQTVDAVEVVHGEWMSWEEADNFIPSPDRHECSVCHDAAQVLVNGLELLSPYCPNCGAKMDGDGND